MAEISYDNCDGGTKRGGHVSSWVRGLEAAETHALQAERSASRSGLMQSVDPRIKVVAILTLIVSATATSSLSVLGLLFAVAVGLALTSGVSLARLSRQVWLGVLLFTGVAVLPAIFLTPGAAIAHVPLLGWAVSYPGLRSAAFVLGRAETAASLASLLILTTPWPHVLKALGAVGVPTPVVAIFGMTYRYVFVLLQTALRLIEARRSRVMRPLKAAERRRMLMSAAGVMLAKSLALSAEVHMAMIARGYRGEVRLLHDFRTRPFDWLFLTATLPFLALALWLRT